jgi:hypothetical protein
LGALATIAPRGAPVTGAVLGVRVPGVRTIVLAMGVGSGAWVTTAPRGAPVTGAVLGAWVSSARGRVWMLPAGRLLRRAGCTATERIAGRVVLLMGCTRMRRLRARRSGWLGRRCGWRFVGRMVILRPRMWLRLRLRVCTLGTTHKRWLATASGACGRLAIGRATRRCGCRRALARIAMPTARTRIRRCALLSALAMDVGTTAGAMGALLGAWALGAGSTVWGLTAGMGATVMIVRAWARLLGICALTSSGSGGVVSTRVRMRLRRRLRRAGMQPTRMGWSVALETRAHG